MQKRINLETNKSMKPPSTMDYATLDQPEVLERLFHPRPEWHGHKAVPNSHSLMIPVQGNISIGACLHQAGKNSPTILFFHGNGEIVSDYDDLGPAFAKSGINFLPVDYRGYGRSEGTPTIGHMMCDCHAILDFVTTWLHENGYSGPLSVMGRSLGSASALELSASRQTELSGLIIESGFAYAAPLLRLLGIDTDALGFVEEKGFRNIDKIMTFQKPVLVIHAEHDHIIPFSDGRALFKACPSKYKTFLEIKNADHNNIFLQGFSEYMASIQTFCDGLRTP